MAFLFNQKGAQGRNSALKWVGWLFFISSLFPAVSVIPLPVQTDTQPNALIAAILVFLVGRRVALPLPIWTLFVLFTAAFILFVTGGLTLDGVRSLLGYTTVFMVATATLVLAASDIRLSDKLLDYAVYIWGFVGLVQLLIWHPFMTFLVTASRTTEERGVTSLSNEPSLYATTMVFFLMLYFIRKREQTFPAFLCVIQIVLFSQSALGVLFVMLMLGLYALLRFSAPTAIIAMIALAGLIFALFTYGGQLLAGTRIGGLLMVVKEAPLRVLQVDPSVAARVASIFYSLKGAIDSSLVPHGFNAWKLYADAQNMAYKGTFSTNSPIDRIMSGYGSALFELGWVGLTIPILITIGGVKFMWRDNPARAISFLLVVHLLLFMPVPLSFPLVGLLIGEVFSKKLGTSRTKSFSPQSPAGALGTL